MPTVYVVLIEKRLHASGALVDMTSNQNAPSTKKMVIMIG
jgi:hypothetical protein